MVRANTHAAAARREINASHRMMEVTEWELQRILLDIHDGPVQHMYAALSQLDLLGRALAGAGVRDPAVLDRIDRVRMLLEGGLGEVRSFIGAFRPPEFEMRSLVKLLEGLALHHEATTDTHVVLDVRGGIPDVPLPVKIALYRVLQEALSNAYRHGGANRAIIHLARLERRGETRLRLSVGDNGHGFDPRATPTDKHYGLKGMRDRVEMIGGRFLLRSKPGMGAMIAVDVPLTAEGEE
jgi:signal transduction histidine kinase